MNRDLGIDYIRVLLTFLVVLHHVAIVYGGAGSWYWKEPLPMVTSLLIFNAINQSFFMGMFFLIAGYFSRASYEKKGFIRFLQDRFIRLGVPLLGYFFILSPLTIALANPVAEVSFFAQFVNKLKAGVFEPGPLWFAEALILFSAAIAALHRSFPLLMSPIKTMPKPWKIVALSLAISSVTFAVRLIIPAGQSVLWLQLGYFPLYGLLFYLGYIAYPQRILQSIDKRMALSWFVVSIAAIAVAIVTHPFSNGSFEGGLNLNAVFYAFWEPFCAVGIIVYLLWYFRAAKENAAGVFLARHAYAIYILHPFVVVACSRLLAHWQVYFLLKFALNGVASIAVCVLIAWALLKIPKVSRVL